MKKELLCASCGHENLTTSRFCAVCGAHMERRCPQCSNAVSDSAIFCDQCGCDIATAQSSNAVALENSHVMLERRQMTVMFCDLRDYTRHSEVLDPEDLRLVLRLFQDSSATVTQKFGGYVSQYLGDGILTLFGFPTANDDDSLRAVLAAMEIVKKIRSMSVDVSTGPLRIAVRIGIATGVVVSGDVIGNIHSREQAIIGNTPNLAARLQSAAGTNEIIVSETTYRLVRHRIEFERVGPLSLYGLSMQTLGYRVCGVAKPSFSSHVRCEPDISSLVNRVEEMEILSQLWSQASKGDGRIVFLQGEPGIGKSRLVQELLRRVSTETHHAMEVHCSSYRVNSALYPFRALLQENKLCQSISSPDRQTESDGPTETRIRELVSKILDALKTSSDNDAHTAAPSEQPYDSIIGLLKTVSAEKPLLFVVEDVHWADPSTIQLIERLLDQIIREPILVVVTSRSGDHSHWLSKRHTVQMVLDRLNPEDTETFVDACTELAPLTSLVRDVIVKRSDGVPLFIEQLSQSILEKSGIEDAGHTLISGEIPGTLRDLLMARLDKLGEAKVLAQLGAVIGREFTHDMLAAVANCTPGELSVHLSRLLNSGLIIEMRRSSTSDYQFKHSLIRDTAYDSLLTQNRSEFHRRIADAMETRFPEMVHSQPDVLARHCVLSGQLMKAVQYWDIASEQALQQSANLEAWNHATEGLRYLAEIDNGKRRDELALSLYIHQSTAISGTQGDSVPEVEAIHLKAEKLLDTVQNQRLAFALVREMHAFHLIRGPLKRAVQLGHQLSDLAAQQNDTQILTDSRRVLGWTYICHGELEKGKALVRDALSIYDKSDSREHTRHDTIDPGAVGMINLAWSEWLTGNPDIASNLARDAVKLSREIDHPYTLAYALCMAAAVFQCRREPEGVLPLVDEAISVATGRNYSYWISWGMSLRGWAISQLGQNRLGNASLATGLASYSSSGATLFMPHILCMSAESLSLSGRHTDARRQLLQAAQIEASNQIYFYSAETQRLLAKSAAELNDVDACVAHFQNSLRIARAQNARGFELRSAVSITECPCAGKKIAPDSRELLKNAMNKLHEGQGSLDYQLAMKLCAIV